MAKEPKILGFIDLKTKEVFNSEGKLLKGMEQTKFIISLLNRRKRISSYLPLLSYWQLGLSPLVITWGNLMPILQVMSITIAQKLYLTVSTTGMNPSWTQQWRLTLIMSMNLQERNTSNELRSRDV